MNRENHGNEREYKIIVNGREKLVTKHKITYEELVGLAFPGESNPNLIYTITYFKGHGMHEGSLVKGQEVTIKDGMIFNVSATNKS